MPGLPPTIGGGRGGHGPEVERGREREPQKGAHLQAAGPESARGLGRELLGSPDNPSAPAVGESLIGSMGPYWRRWLEQAGGEAPAATTTHAHPGAQRPAGSGPGGWRPSAGERAARRAGQGRFVGSGQPLECSFGRAPGNLIRPCGLVRERPPESVWRLQPCALSSTTPAAILPRSGNSGSAPPCASAPSVPVQAWAAPGDETPAGSGSSHRAITALGADAGWGEFYQRAQ